MLHPGCFLVRYLFLFNNTLKMFLCLFNGSLAVREVYAHMTKHGVRVCAECD